MKNTRRWIAGVCLAAAAMTQSFVYGQRPQGVIQGRVADSSGAVIPGASVQVKGPSGFSRAVTTDAEGRYAVDGLPRGTYSVQVEWPGFTTFESKPIEVSGSRPRVLDVRLELSETRQQVTVEADGSEPVSTAPASNASAIVLQGKDLDALPDDPDDLLSDLQAMAGPAVTSSGGELFVDGFSGGRLPPKESIREIRINQNPFSAEYDHPGFGRIEVFTKPGSDKFHGMASFKFSDAALDSRNPFSTTKPPYQSRDFGGNVGGPLGRRASFFADVERRTIDESAIVNALVLDDSLNAIRLNQAIPNPRMHTTVSPRVDYRLNGKNTLTARYTWSDTSQENGGVGGFSLASQGHSTSDTSHTIQLTETAVLSTTTINETRFQYIRNNLRVDGDNTLPAVNVLDSFVGGGAQVGHSSNAQNRYELQNATIITRGAHSIKFGGRLRVLSLSDFSPRNFGGTFTFGGENAPLLDANNQPIPGADGKPVLGYISSLERYRRTLLFQSEGLSASEIRALGGGPSQFSIAGGDPSAHVPQADVGVFLQDDWRARPSLTLSFGLRYEAQGNIRSRADFAPRFGFAWAPGAAGRKKRRIVIRGGSGIFYDRADASLTLQALRFDGIHEQQFIIHDPSFSPRTPSTAELLLEGASQTVRTMDAGLRSPYSIVSSIGIERDLPGKFKVASTFTHTRSVHLLQSRNINAPLPAAGGERPFGQSNIYQYESGGVLNGNQIITNVSRSFSRRLGLFGYYAYGRIFANTDGPSTFPANQYDLSREYGRAAIDIRHRFVLGGSISGPHGFTLSPFLVGRSGAPFDITTGQDTNGDSLFTDRPALAGDPLRPGVVVTRFGAFDPNPPPGTPIIPRNYGQGPAFFALNLRLSKTIGFGGERSGRPGKRSKSKSKKRRESDGAPNIDENNFYDFIKAEKSDQRFNLTFLITARNLLNNVSQGIPVGNLTSPIFGTSNWLASTAGPYHPSYGDNRQLQLQIRLGF